MPNSATNCWIRSTAPTLLFTPARPGRIASSCWPVSSASCSAQAEVVHAVTELLADRGERAAIVNGEMGCGKTTVGIATAAVLHAEGYRRTLVLSPRTWSASGAGKSRRPWPAQRSGCSMARTRWSSSSSCASSWACRRAARSSSCSGVRMRMGFHWKPVFNVRRTRHGDVGACPDCGQVITNLDGEPINPVELEAEDYRRRCSHCAAPLWTLMRPRSLSASDQSTAVFKALQRIPTIGEVTAQKLMRKFGDSSWRRCSATTSTSSSTSPDGNGELVFSDRQAHRMERAMANMEFGFGEGGYQPSEFVKRYLPQGTFDLLIADEAHEYKNGGSAQGQAMGVLAAKARKTLLLTGTLMGGYGDDLSTCCSEPCRTNDRRRLPPDQERQHDLGRDGVHARSRRPSRTSIPRARARRTRRPRATRSRCARSRRRASARKACCVACCRSRSSSS